MPPRASGDPDSPSTTGGQGAVDALLDAGRFTAARDLVLDSPETPPARALARICAGLWPSPKDTAADAFLLRVLERRPSAEPIRVLERLRFLRGDLAGVEEALLLGLQGLPQNVSLLRELSKILTLRKKLPEARERARELLAIEPTDLEGQATLAFVDAALGRLDDGLRSLREIERRAPDLVTPSIAALMLYSTSTTPEEIFEAHLRLGAQIEARTERRTVTPRSERPTRLKVGYVSADFRQHSVASFILPVLRGHDRARFDVHCYHTHPGADEVTRAIASLDLGFHDVSGSTDDQLAERIERDGIDVLVDLGGHTEHSRIGVFARRSAPLQISYLGYAATSGLRAMDARITDSIADPPGSADDLHTERLLRIDPCAWCFEPNPAIAIEPRDEGSPVTFGSFNASIKLVPDVVRAWAEILKRAPASRLLLKARAFATPDATERMRDLFESFGIDGDRLTMKGWTRDTASHLTAYREVDIALDPFPYNGTTTTCEALYMGVPVVTLTGNRHAGRVGTSLLSAMGLGDLIATSTDGYVAIATGLARDPARLRDLRFRLRGRMLDSPLCKPEPFVRKLESAIDQLFAERLDPSRTKMDSELRSRYLESARKASDAGKLELAAHFAGRLLASIPTHVDLAMICARASEAAGEVREAARILAAAAAPHLEPGAAGAPPKEASVKDPSVFASALSPRELLQELARLRGKLGDSAGRERALQRAVELFPDSADCKVALATHLRSLGRTVEAKKHLEAALLLEPRHARALMLLGVIDMAWGKGEIGVPLLERAVESDPKDPVIHSNLLYAHQYCEDAREAGFRRHLLYGVRHGRRRALPPVTARNRKEDRIRIGYLSADFREHSVARFMEAITLHHDRARFDVRLYASVADPDSTTERLGRSVDAISFVHDRNDEETAHLIAEDGIDILIELGGHTAKSRLGVLAYRPAPVQITYLGYPDTTGVPAVDYRLTDGVVDPEGASDPFHVEKLVRLPDTAWCFVARPESPPVSARGGRGSIVFGSFNDLAKIGDSVLETWADILARVPGSRLLLKSKFAGDEPVASRVRSVLERAGVDVSRCELRYGSADVTVHLSAYGEIDVALDPFPYCGTTTTCEALDMGVPVVSLVGARHVSRVGASILGQVGLSDLVATSRTEYVEIAVRLANDGERRTELREKLRHTLRTSALGDAVRFTRGLETAFRQMWRRHLDGGSIQAGEAISDERRKRASELVLEASAALAKGRSEEAEVIARQAVATDPTSPETYNVLGNALVLARFDEEAEAAYRTAIAFDSGFYKAFNNIGNLLSKRGDKLGAIEMFGRSIVLEPKAPRAHANLAAAERDLGRLDDAVASYGRSLDLQVTPLAAIGLCDLWVLRGEFDRAEETLRRAKAALPGEPKLDAALATVSSKRAAASTDGKALEAARVTSLARARELLRSGNAPEAARIITSEVVGGAELGGLVLAEALDILWRSRLASGDVEGAWAGFERALVSGEPERSFARAGLLAAVDGERLIGTLRFLSERHVDKPKLAFVYASQLLAQGRIGDAEQTIVSARAKHPNDLDLESLHAAISLALGRQTDAVAMQREVAERLPGGSGVTSDLLLSLHYTDETTEADLYAEHSKWGQWFDRVDRLDRALPRPREGRKLRIGYLSGDFYRHSVGRLIAPILSHHDRSRFEIHVYMTNPAHDALTDHVKGVVDVFREVWSLDDAELAKTVRRDEIDILVELSGHTAWSRLGALARKPAFIQASYLGYPDTTGLDAVDYRITDAVADPPGAERHYIEDLIRLPRTQWSFSTGQKPRSRTHDSSAPVCFGSFNNLAKLTPTVVRAWSSIIERAPGSRLLLKAAGLEDEVARAEWRARFAAVNLDPVRLELMGHEPEAAKHLELYDRVDVALDPFPYNGTMTTCEALAMGVPVVTLRGERHASRVGASLLASVGQDELVASDLGAYVRIAAGLASDRTLLRKLSNGLADRVAHSPLGDVAGLTFALETAFEEMWQRGPRPPRGRGSSSGGRAR